jgi:uncharacterized protein (DUF1684 family)
MSPVHSSLSIPALRRPGGSRYTLLMPMRKLIPLVLAAAILLGSICTAYATEDSSWRAEILQWRKDHAADLLRPDGWLSLSGLVWLQEGDNTVGSAADGRIRVPAGNPPQIAILRLSGQSVTLLAPVGGFPAGFQLAGSSAKEGPLRVDPDKDKYNPHLTIGTLNMYIIRRADRFALRIKDSHSAALLNFHGLNWYPPNPAYRVTGKWIPYNPQKTVMLATLVGTSYSQPVPGAVAFVLQGKSYRLEPVLEDPDVPKLFFILRDKTSATTTYGACRFLYTGLPSNGLDKPGELVMDFNRLENPPCAYTPYATCPLPPAGNRLPISLPVGEKRYHN